MSESVLPMSSSKRVGKLDEAQSKASRKKKSHRKKKKKNKEGE